MVDGTAATLNEVVDGATDFVDGVLGTDVSDVVDEPVQGTSGVLGSLLRP
jgi:hypothetical protein